MSLRSTRRLFVDPASVSSGWALFEGSKLHSSGTVAVPAAWPVWKRLGAIACEYNRLFRTEPLASVHLENVPYRPTCHIYVHYSVAVICLALWGSSREVCAWDKGVPVKAWQKFCGWEAKGGKVLTRGPLLKKFKVQSNDEAAAVGLGLFFLSTLEGGSFGSRKKA